uniref:Uncharacterized protein n=1 Tax=Tanacetum cinerariifolium TaxID=118510 RepID=A0A6L2P073_TANCI|nr:hypothetical protein [Tanacetum cinerariifolium]
MKLGTLCDSEGVAAVAAGSAAFVVLVVTVGCVVGVSVTAAVVAVDGEGDDGGAAKVGSFGGVVVMERQSGCCHSGGSQRLVVVLHVVDLIDRATRSDFGVFRKISPENFSGSGGGWPEVVVVAGDKGGRLVVVRSREKCKVCVFLFKL